MGLQANVYVGPYLEIKDRRVLQKAQAAGCPNHGAINTRAPFCSQCGAPVSPPKPASVVHKACRPGELEDDLSEMFWSPEFSQGTKGYSIWLPNCGGGGSTFGQGSAAKALPLDAGPAIAAFTAHYQEAIEAIRQLEGFSEMAVRYGVVPYSN